MDSEGAAMQLKIDETMASLTSKLGALEHQVNDTVKSVKDSVKSVRDTVDIKRQVRLRPWMFVAGATALGFLGGIRANRRQLRHPKMNENNMLVPNSPTAELLYSNSSESAPGSTGARQSTRAMTNWLAGLGTTFQPEIAELKGIVIGTMMELAREVITRQVYKHTTRPSHRSSNDEAL